MSRMIGTINTKRATGGVVTEPGDGYTYHTFTGDGVFTINNGSNTSYNSVIPPKLGVSIAQAIPNIDILLVGGGGSSFDHRGGGGGGGGVVKINGKSVVGGTSYNIVIGVGAAIGLSGSNTTFNGTDIIAYGGGCGSSDIGIPANGGCGGGGYATGQKGLASHESPNPQGFDGGLGDLSSGYGAGGGGAGAVGNTTSQNSDGGAGKAGFDTTKYGGGGGGNNTYSCSGGDGGGGIGGCEHVHSRPVGNGADGQGGGGGGGGTVWGSLGAGQGGRGFVKIRYLT